MIHAGRHDTATEGLMGLAGTVPGAGPLSPHLISGGGWMDGWMWVDAG